MEIIWKIENTERRYEDGGIIIAHWRATAIDGIYTSSVYGSVGFTPEPDSEDFIPYNQLTEQNILSWLWNSDELDRTVIEDKLINKIENQKTPTTVIGLPW